MFVNGSRIPPIDGRHRVMVYGTLKQSYGNHNVIRGQGTMYLTSARLKGYLMVDCGMYPAIIKATDPNWVVYGELYEVDKTALDRCDRLEGVPHHYQRVEVDLEDNDGKCWTYVQNRTITENTAFFPRGVWYPAAPRYLWKPTYTPQHEIVTSIIPPTEGLISAVPDTWRRNRPPVIVDAPKPKETAPETTSSIPLKVGPGWEEAAPEETGT